MKRALLPIVIGMALTTASCRKNTGPAPVDFAKDIKPLIQSRCINCHHSGALFGNLNLENRTHAFKTRPGGPVITPGEPEKSPFYIVLTLPEPARKAMPPMDHQISQQEVELVKSWIQQGANWPDGKEGSIKPQVPDKPAS